MNTFYKSSHIVLTGGFGFIGSNMIRFLNDKGIAPFVIERGDLERKRKNVEGLAFTLVDDLPYPGLPSTVVHLGAEVATTAPKTPELLANNIDYTLNLLAKRKDYCGPIPRFIYASSGAVYGNEEKDFAERLDVKPMNPYAETKLALDVALKDEPNVYGLRFFNVWGPRESHKGNMKSIIARALEVTDGTFDIFKTGRPDIPDGEQSRDFVFVEDLCKVIWHFITTEDNKGGLFNVGSGKATSFNEIAGAMGLKKRYVEMPDSVKNQYQYHTCADLTKLRASGYNESFLTVREGLERMRAQSTSNE